VYVNLAFVPNLGLAPGRFVAVVVRDLVQFRRSQHARDCRNIHASILHGRQEARALGGARGFGSAPKGYLLGIQGRISGLQRRSIRDGLPIDLSAAGEGRPRPSGPGSMVDHLSDLVLIDVQAHKDQRRR
jgi:hypothetical protein